MNLGWPTPSAQDSGGQKPYAEYKDSGIDWLPEIPASWKAKRLRFLCRINPPKSEIADLPPDLAVSFLPMERVSEDGRLDLEESRMLDDVRGGYTYFRNGDIVVAKITPCFENGKGAIGADLLNGIGFGTTEFHVLRPSNVVDPSFLFYLTKCHPFRTMGAALMTGAAGQKRVPESFLRDLWLGLPPVDEQQAIVAFLDRETARIDAMLAKKERLIALLEEKRTALVSHAVTKGLNPNAPMKDSGIDWLGPIPVQWEVKRLKHIVPHVTVGIVVTPAKYYVAAGVPCLRSLNVRENRLLDSDLVFISRESNDLHAKSQINSGDVVVVRTGQPGTAAVIDQRFDGANCIDLIIVRKSTKVLPELLAFVANSGFAKMQFLAGSDGAIQQHFNIEMAKDLLVPLPCLPEQQQIVDELREQEGRMQAIVTKNREVIAKLQEHRAALISAAVTGKIDVGVTVGVERP